MIYRERKRIIKPFIAWMRANPDKASELITNICDESLGKDMFELADRCAHCHYIKWVDGRPQCDIEAIKEDMAEELSKERKY